MNYKLIYDIEPLNIYKLNYTKCTNPIKINLVKKLLEKNLTINKITNFIKYYKDGEIFYILLNMINFPLLIEWYYETNILKYYWSDSIIYNLIKSNRNKLKISYFNNGPLKDHLINLNNQFNLNFNYTDTLLKKKYEYIMNIIETKLCLYAELPYKFNFGEDFVSLLGSNNYKDYLNSDLTITIYSENDIKFKNKTLLKQKIPYYYLKIDNIIFKIFMYKYDFNFIMAFKENSLITTEKEIYSNAEFYQNMNFKEKEDIHSYKDIEIYEIKLKNIVNPSDQNINSCYICKKFYDKSVYIENYENLCIECGIESHSNLNLRADLNGLVFLITGGRVKIGYGTALKLLRNGATIIVTTRYPNFAMSNYQSEPDYNEWKDKLTIMECDFTKLKEIYSLVDILSEYKINGIINNACQTIRQSKQYYQTVGEIETNLKENIIHNNLQIKMYKSNRCILKDTVYNQLVLNMNLNSIKTVFRDIRDNLKESSWDQKIDEISHEEIVEATLINQVVPTLLINKLKPRLVSPKFIINVTSLEGIFNSKSKTDKHIHTNMCKAAMNMMIRSLAEDPDKDLHVYAINPGYVSGVLPQNDKYQVPLEDGASRICYPIIRHMKGETLGKEYTLMSNYKPIENW